MGAKLLQPSMTAGELAPSLHGRVDLARYATGLKKLRNFVVRPYGGVENRTGFGLCALAGASPVTRLIPFVYSTEVAYVLVLGDNHVRFLSGGAPVLPSTVAYAAGTTYVRDAYVTSAGITYRSLQHANIGNTPASSPAWWVADSGLQMTTAWSADQIWDLHYTQSADVLYLTHPDVPPRELRRLAPNQFETRILETRDGPFQPLNADEAIVVAASGSQGLVQITANEPIFTPGHVGGVFYIEPQNLGAIKPWVVGDRSVIVGALRRSDGKTYRAVTVPAAGAWHETGPRTPVHESGRSWDGGGDTKTNGADTWSVGVEWEYVDSGFGVVRISGYTSPTVVDAQDTRRLPAAVVGGVGAPATTWNLVGDGVSKTFPVAGAGYGRFSVTIDGTALQSDPYYVPPPRLGGTGTGETSGTSRESDQLTVLP